MGSTIKVAQKVLELVDRLTDCYFLLSQLSPETTVEFCALNRASNSYIYIYIICIYTYKQYIYIDIDIDTSLSLDDGNTSRCMSLGQCRRRSSGRLRRWTQGAWWLTFRGWNGARGRIGVSKRSHAASQTNLLRDFDEAQKLGCQNIYIYVYIYVYIYMYIYIRIYIYMYIYIYVYIYVYVCIYIYIM